MNPFGSYRALFQNSTAALASAIEIYNKPRVSYRDECAVILLVNAWELLLKASLSRDRRRIFYPKRRGEPYRTYSLSDALNKATPLFPPSVSFSATAKNLELLAGFRDNAVHFYNEPAFGLVIFGLAQTAITNYRDFASITFDVDVADELSLALVPLTVGAMIDPIDFVRKAQTAPATSQSVREFTSRLRDAVASLESTGADTARLLTVFRADLISTKKITNADFTVGVQSAAGAGPPLLVQHAVDPNKSHPYREKDIIGTSKQPELGIRVAGKLLGQFEFRALGHSMKAKDNPKWFWADSTGAVARYSNIYVEVLKGVTSAQLDAALKAYRSRK